MNDQVSSGLFFTSDLHLRHAKMLEYQADTRPFKGTKSHDNTLISNWNNKVSKDSTVFVLGDFSMEGPESYSWYSKVINKLNGTKILVLGNHDKLNPFKYIELGFHSVHTHYLIHNICMVHDPSDIVRLEAFNPDVTTFLCGHVHSLFKSLLTPTNKRVINVGVDCWNLEPVSYNEIQSFVWGIVDESKTELFQQLVEYKSKNRHKLGK